MEGRREGREVGREGWGGVGWRKGRVASRL